MIYDLIILVAVRVVLQSKCPTNVGYQAFEFSVQGRLQIGNAIASKRVSHYHRTILTYPSIGLQA